MIAAARMARSRQARADAGGKHVAVMLTPLAAKKLAQWRLSGTSVTTAINRLLETSNPQSP